MLYCTLLYIYIITNELKRRAYNQKPKIQLNVFIQDRQEDREEKEKMDESKIKNENCVIEKLKQICPPSDYFEILPSK